jgi:hypothetical protein
MKSAIACVAVLALGALSAGPGEQPLVVHEWGTFTSVSGSDGTPILWNPLSGPTDLPSFVYRPDRRHPELALTKSSYRSTIRMETPVLYFYAEKETDVKVKVAFPKGAITEWYPKAASAWPDGIDWGRIRIRPGAPEEFPREAEESHYYPARETDGAPLRVTSPGIIQDEKFLFYRGVGSFALPIRITLANDRVTLKNLGKDPVPAILFENRNGRTGFRLLGALKDEVNVAPPELRTPASEAMAELERMLIRSGLYEKEARAMLKTWRESWFEEGLRVFYLVPRAAADAILPLTLDPKPEDVVRVFVGRAELLTPEMETRMREIVKRVGGDYSQLWTAIQPFGRFAQPLLRLATATLRPQELPPAVQQVLDFH